MSPCTHSTVVDFRRARSSISPEKSRPVTMPPAGSRRDREVARAAAGVEHPVAGLHDGFGGEPAPAPVEPDGHDAVHHVVDRRDPVEHARARRPAAACRSRASRLAPARHERVVDADLVEARRDDEVDEILDRLGAVVEAGRREAGSPRPLRAGSASRAGGSTTAASRAERARACGAPSARPRRRDGSGSPSRPLRACRPCHRARTDDVGVDLRRAARIRALVVVEPVDRDLARGVADEACEHLVARAASRRRRARSRSPRSPAAEAASRSRSPPPPAPAGGVRRTARQRRR